MSDNLIIKHLFFKPADYALLLKSISKKDYEELSKADAILLSTEAKSEVIMEYINKPFSRLKEVKP